MAIQVYGLKAFKSELKGVIRDLKVTWLLEELGLSYERIVMDPEKGQHQMPDYTKMSPTGKIPTLVDDGFCIFESAAICEYLGEKYGMTKNIGSADYYLAKQWNYFIVSNVEPQTSRIFGCDFFYEKNEATSQIRTMAFEQLARFLKPLNERLASQTYLLGETFSVTDVLLVSTLMAVRHTPVLGDYPQLKRHFEACCQRSAFQKALLANGEVN